MHDCVVRICNSFLRSFRVQRLTRRCHIPSTSDTASSYRCPEPGSGQFVAFELAQRIQNRLAFELGEGRHHTCSLLHGCVVQPEARLSGSVQMEILQAVLANRRYAESVPRKEHTLSRPSFQARARCPAMSNPSWCAEHRRSACTFVRHDSSSDRGSARPAAECRRADRAGAECGG